MMASVSSDAAPRGRHPASRILVLAAHPDDEVVACAAAIGRAQQEGAQVFVLFMTHGCIARETLWPWQRSCYEAFVARRREEAEKVCRFLGVTPVGFSERPARHLWRRLPEAYAEVQQAIAAHQIDQVWVPAYEGGNADHDGLNALGKMIARASQPARTNSLPLAGRVREGGVPQKDASTIQESPRTFAPLPNPPREGEGIPPCLIDTLAHNITVLEFAEYNFEGGKAHSQEFPFPNGTETTLILTPEEQARKKAALKIYASEEKNLGYVRVERECFRPLAAYDYSKPPHEGTLWYARFQWVPFRHPRVDFTKPEEVSKAILRFLG